MNAMPSSTQYHRVLSIDPSVAGFGFVVLEDGQRLIDWGVARLWSHNSQEFLTRVEAMIERYQPALVVSEDCSASRRGRRAGSQVALLMAHCRQRQLPVALVTRQAVRQAFSETGITKHAIAMAIAMQFPEVEPRLPQRRKPWNSEDERMNIFDALSFAIALRDAGVANTHTV